MHRQAEIQAGAAPRGEVGGIKEKLNLRLTEARTFGNGNVLLHDARAA